MHIALFIKVIYWIQILLNKNYFILFFLQSHFSDEQSKFLILQFYWNKKFQKLIHSRTEIKISLSFIGVKFLRRQDKKVCCL